MVGGCLRLLDPRNVLGAGHDDVVGKPSDRDEAAVVGCRGRDRLVEGGGERLWCTTFVWVEIGDPLLVVFSPS